MATAKLFVSLAFFLILSVCVSHGAARSQLEEESMRQRYQQWMRRYGRVYRSHAEKEQRFKTFKSNVEFIDSFNRDGKKSFKLGINQFADMTNEEFTAYRNGFKPSHLPKVGSNIRSSPSFFKHQNDSAVPSSVDWRKKGAVTPVKNQGQCGCCWAFSAVAAVEGITKLSTGKLVSLSEQELVDCDTKGENKGCQGGLMDGAFKFIKQNGGLTTEANYPYKGADGTCSSNRKSQRAAKISGYEDVPANSEEALMKAVAKQPVSVAIDAGGLFFQFYFGGVFSGFCGTNLDHGVTAVGYGTSEDGTKYWLVKNSWGSSWGEEGYIKMKRDAGAKEGICGIAMQASYPIA